MKRIIFAIAVLFSLAACNQNKPIQAVENQNEVSAQEATTDTISEQTKQQNMKEVQAYLKECGV